VRPHEEHRARGPKELSFWVVTVSTSRYEAMASGRSYTDESGDAAVSLISRAGHRVVGRSLVKDDLVMIRGVVMDLLRRSDVDVVVLTGGTGVARTDVTIEAVRPLLEKELDGFGDVFRLKSYQRSAPPRSCPERWPVSPTASWWSPCPARPTRWRRASA
jgi:Molybdopterin biosynthesis enzymes